MTKLMDGICFKNMVDYAVRNLNQHVKIVNQLNVFPVPDGDTGTNMVTTIHKGLQAIGETISDLPAVSKKFARSVVYEARGNSGVIVSQFMKGISEKFYDVELVDGALFIEALEKGVQYAYQAVAAPVEGTMLTVIRDATEAVKKEFHEEQGINEIIDSFVEHAKVSLDRTPELLAVLKESGVVDSGGAGIVYLFEGMKKYLDGETLDNIESKTETTNVDYDSFDRFSTFEYGYCTELLLQLLHGKEEFLQDEFKEDLFALGESVVLSVEGDKVRIHIHTQYPEQVFTLCHRYGEFLTCKIDNMSVQHTETTKRILCSDTENDGSFSVVTVAFDPMIQKLFVDMGADVSICCEKNISTKDYIDAFNKVKTENILVFPNSTDAILTAMQAKKLYPDAKITVINSRGIAECYAALPTVDFEEDDIEKVADDITKVINNLYVFSVAKRNNTIRYGNRDICRNEFYSFSGKELISVSKNLETTAIQAVEKILKKYQKEIVTIFHKTSIKDEQIEQISEAIKEHGFCAEVFTVPIDNLSCELTISLE